MPKCNQISRHGKKLVCTLFIQHQTMYTQVTIGSH
jgi:hypothetical protein